MQCLHKNCKNPVKIKLLPSERHNYPRFFCEEHFNLVSEIFDFIMVPEENIIAYKHFSEKLSSYNGIKIEVPNSWGPPTTDEDAVTVDYLIR